VVQSGGNREGEEPLHLMIELADDGRFHILALSGGFDSTCLAFELKEREPRLYNFVCTPTGDEPPAMFEHWKLIGEKLGRPLHPVMAMWKNKTTGLMEGGLDALILREGTIPNRRIRFCTRALKIEPYREFLKELAAKAPVVSYVGLRADEEGRAGGAYADIAGVEMRFPLREWGFDRQMVVGAVNNRGIVVPERTDCQKCYHQQIGEWFVLWFENRPVFDQAISYETQTGRTFREPKFLEDGSPAWTHGRGKMRWPKPYLASSRDSWPVRLADLAELFAAGFIPPTATTQRDLFTVGACRVCSL
jgi:hypothetical protein